MMKCLLGPAHYSTVMRNLKCFASQKPASTTSKRRTSIIFLSRSCIMTITTRGHKIQSCRRDHVKADPSSTAPRAVLRRQRHPRTQRAGRPTRSAHARTRNFRDDCPFKALPLPRGRHRGARSGPGVAARERLRVGPPPNDAALAGRARAAGARRPLSLRLAALVTLRCAASGRRQAGVGAGGHFPAPPQ